MNKDNFNDHVLDRIHSQNIAPLGRWYFMTERWFFVMMIALATFIGSVAVTTTLFVLTDHDWFAVEYLDEGVLVHAIKTVPYVWLAIMMAAILLVRWNIKKIGNGYRYSSWRIIAWSFIASISVGTALFYAGAGTYFDNYFDHAIPQYRALVRSNKDIWIYPEDGLLSGKIQTKDASGFTIIDSDDQPWTISVDQHTVQQENTIIPGKWVKLTGEMTDGSHFSATRIFPWSNERN